MLRLLLNYIRQSVFGKLLPVDESIAFHKLVGHVLMVLAVVHTIAHLLNYSTLDQSMAFSLLQTSAGLTGVLLLAVFLVMLLLEKLTDSNLLLELLIKNQ